MADAQQPFNSIARQAIEQCRREIAAGWEQLNAAREILQRTEWLYGRWAAQADSIVQQMTVNDDDAARADSDMFVYVAPKLRKPWRRKSGAQVRHIRRVRSRGAHAHLNV